MFLVLSFVSTWIYLLILTLFSWYVQWKWSRKSADGVKKVKNMPVCLPLLGHSYLFLGGSEHIYESLKQIFDSYPKIWKGRLGTKIYYGTADPEYMEVILNHPKALDKGEMYTKQFSDLTGEGLFSAPANKKWRKNRKAIGPAFNQKILDTFIPTFESTAKLLVEKLKKNHLEEEFCIFNCMSNCTLETLFKTAMGFNMEVQAGDVRFAQSLNRVMEIMWLRIFKIWYYFNVIFKWLPAYKELESNMSYIQGLVDSIIQEKKKNYAVSQEKVLNEEYEQKQDKSGPIKYKAFLDLLLEMEGVKFTDRELREESITFTLAGSDTSATSMSFACLMLGMHPESQEKIHKEVAEVIGENEIDQSHLVRLVYLERFIKETMRLFPAGALVVREIHESIRVRDFVLEAPSSIVAGIIHMHRNPNHWPNPLKFDPDRFLPEECAKRLPSTYSPFSQGPRNCIGQRFAMMVMKVILATLVKNFKISTPYKNIEDIKLTQNVLLRTQDGFLVTFHERK